VLFKDAIVDRNKVAMELWNEYDPDEDNDFEHWLQSRLARGRIKHDRKKDV